LPVIPALWRQDLVKFLAFMAVLFAVVLGGVAGWLTEGIGDMQVGDAGTWFSGLATTAVAVLAWRTARHSARTAEDAARTAKATYADQLREEAANVTWWFEERFARPEDLADPALRDFLPPEGLLPWEHLSPEPLEISAWAVVRVQNNNTSVVSKARLLMNDDPAIDPASAGMQLLGTLRPGPTRFKACIRQAGGSEGANWSAARRLVDNGYAAWLEFNDSRGRRWRRLADGTLLALEDHEGPLIAGGPTT
jgi:hypothetical protein